MDAPTADTVAAALQRLLTSPQFASSPRARRFIRFVVEATLGGLGDSLKEYVLGVEVFDRAASFDPRTDSIVRVEAVKLRKRLQAYYRGAGRRDPVIINIPKGGYVPQFRLRSNNGPACRPARFVVSSGAATVENRLPADYQPKIMLVVLPFEDLIGNEEDEYFSDGLTEELITELARMNPERLGVIARTSAMKFKRSGKGIDQVSRELNVNYVLEGTVRRIANLVRINARLIQASDQTHLWADRHDRNVGDIFALQSDVAREIARQIGVKLTPAAERRWGKTRPVDAEAHEAYLRGRYCWNKRTKGGLERAIRYFREATEKDPGYALAYTGLADSYFLIAGPAYSALGTTEAHKMAKSAVYLARQIDDMLPEVHTSLAQLKLTEFDWAGAEKELQRAIELNSNYATAYHWYGLLLSALGRFDEAIAAAKVACSLDPLSAIISRDLGLVFYYARQLDRAVEQYRNTLNFEPDFAQARQSLGRAYLDKGMYDEAIQEIEKADALSGSAVYTRAALAQAYAVTDRIKEAEKILSEMTARSRSSHVPPTTFAVIYTALRDSRTALDWLEKAYVEHDTGLHTIKVHPIFDPLHPELRFQNLLRRMNLT